MCHAVEPWECVVVIGNLSRAAPGNLEHFRCGIFRVGAGETANTVGKNVQIVTSVQSLKPLFSCAADGRSGHGLSRSVKFYLTLSMSGCPNS